MTTVPTVGEILKKQEKISQREYYRKQRRASIVAPKRDSACMTGKGLGNNLGLDDPEYTVWKTPAQNNQERMLAAEEKAAQKEASLKKAAATRARNKAKKAILAAKMDRGELLSGQRVFLATWVRDNWDVAAENFGGIPQGVDIANTDFGHLLIVPVVEEDEGEGLRFKRSCDPDGRNFWVRAEVKNSIQKIFGSVDWRRPLTMQEAEQFGITFVGEEHE